MENAVTSRRFAVCVGGQPNARCLQRDMYKVLVFGWLLLWLVWMVVTRLLPGPLSLFCMPSRIMRSLKRNVCSGLTTVELLTVVAIVATTIAIVMPVLARAKLAGLESVEISQLRQIGQSKNIYSSDSNDGDCDLNDLIAASAIPKVLLSSPLDPDSKGRSNRIAIELVSVAGAPADYSKAFRLSYVGAHTFGWPKGIVDKYLAEKPRRGWLLSYSRSVPKRGYETLFNGQRGQYLRLLLDGSVMHSSHDVTDTMLDESPGDSGDSPFFDFADWTIKEKTESFKAEK